MARLRQVIEFLNGFRKLTIVVAVILVTTAMLIMGYIDSETYGKIMVASIPAYMAGNVGEHVSKNVKDWIETLKKR
jgi:type IV secretory pathway VirB2 component (pilin)